MAPRTRTSPAVPRRRTPDVAALRRRLEAGDWLTIQDVADVLHISRSTADRLMRMDPPTIRSRPRPGGSYRECHPDDVLRELRKRGGP